MSSNGFSMLLGVSKSGTIEGQQNFQKENPRNVNQSFLITNEPNRYSGVRFDVQPTSFKIFVNDAWPNDLIRYQLQNVNRSTRFTNDDFKLVGGLAELEFSDTLAWFKSGTTIYLRFSMPADGDKWFTERVVQFAL